MTRKQYSHSSIMAGSSMQKIIHKQSAASFNWVYKGKENDLQY